MKELYEKIALSLMLILVANLALADDLSMAREFYIKN